MKRLYLIILMVLSMCLTGTAQNYTREGNTFISSTGERTKQEATKTKFTWKDSKGKDYPIYISSSGSCFVLRVSNKTGKEYRYYLGAEISQQICKELNVAYKSRIKNKN